MYISSLTLNQFRNYTSQSVLFPKDGALFVGSNGTGKTNILEAIYFLSFGKSQRNASKQDMIHSNASEAYLEGVYRDTDSGSSPVKVSIGFSRDKRVVLTKNNNKVLNISDFICQSAVVSFSSHDIALVYGDPSERRKFIDTILCQTDNHYLESCIIYKKNLLHRNFLLKNQQLSDGSIVVYEEKMAESAAYIWQQRQMFFNHLTNLLSRCYKTISPSGSCEGTVEYNPNQSFENNLDDIRSGFTKVLQRRRKRDSQIGYSTTGPHRDDFTCFLDKKPIKTYGSQGQCRSMVLALRLSALEWIDVSRPDNSLVLIDDAFSELDEVRREQVSYLLQKRGQVFVTALLEQKTFFKQQKFIVHDNKVSAA